MQVNRDAYTDATLEAVDFITKIRPYYYQTGATHYLPPVSDIEQAYMPNLSASLKKEFVSNWAQLFSDTVYNCARRATDVVRQQIEREHELHFHGGRRAAILDCLVQRHWHNVATCPGDTPGWPAWSFWQWSDGTDKIAKSNLVPGTNGSVDRDVFSGTSAQLAAMAVHLLPGDYNHDGVVDAADYVVWRNSVGSTVNLAADGNNDGVVNSSDYTYWRQRVGQTAGSGSGSGADLSPGSVPEPCTALLLGIGSVMALSRRHVRSRR